MKFAQIDQTEANLIEAYDRHSIRIGGHRYDISLVVSARAILTDWGADRIDRLDANHMELLLETQPEVIIIGTGTRQQFPDPIVYSAMLERGIGVEIMDTGAACRTYNILVSEGRRVVAGLLLDAPSEPG